MEYALGRSMAIPMAWLLFIVLCTFNALSEPLGVGEQRCTTCENVGALVTSKPELSILGAALKKAKLWKVLGEEGKTFTLFAPTNDALEKIFKEARLTCVHDFYKAQPCTSTADLLSSTNLKTILLNFVVEGSFRVKDLEDGDLLQFVGSSVEQIHNSKTGIYIGNAKVLIADLLVENGVTHVVDNVLGSIDPRTMHASDVSINATAIHAASRILDADIFEGEELEEAANGVLTINIPGLQANRGIVGYPDGGLRNHMPLIFDPGFNKKEFSEPDTKFTYPTLRNVQRPESDEDLAFMSVLQLGSLIRSKQVTSLELVKLYTARLKKVDYVLKAVVTYTEKLALEQAAAADKLLAEGVYLGPLHGIPYGLKDIFAVPGYRTTWGSGVFKNQVINEESWVYQKLKAAGAVLIAKLATGSLAWDDIWFGGQTKNPWNIREGSTGSSCGPAASTSAGNVPFAIGSETAGSIVYPSSRTGITGLRPTFGMVGRSWVMSLSESMDKIGSLCRFAADCAVVLDIIRGKDPRDWSSGDIHLEDPFSVDVTKLTVGYLPDADMGVVKALAAKKVKMVPFDLNYTVPTAQFLLNVTMDVETLAHFDHWQRAGEDAKYEDQTAWPVELRRARFISAVDYVQAQRVRGKLATEVMHSIQEQRIDAFIGNATDWEKVCVGNLVGLPVIVIPTGLKEINGTRRRITVQTGIYGAPYQDGKVLALAMAYQSDTNHHLQRPPVDNLGPEDDSLPY
ncbi:hypothetical protein KC19_1G142400 [Ceratodon purpureus]|uniref:FAS1 domain-containing protein n=1 Tax=Ceratodon purpureus TaxID=3225 RepID=A0A8T0J514_CERPU|nr:hypothetical protein KC19_1G142400 [Ceratodon purpureus]